MQEQHQYNVVIDPTIRSSLEYRHLTKGTIRSIWENPFANKIVWLAQRVGTKFSSGDIKIWFIHKEQFPAGRTVPYEIIVDEIYPQKSETHRTRLNMGVNLINLLGEVNKPKADIKTSKLIFNSVLLTKNAKFMCSDIDNLYLNNPMDRYKYIKLPMENFPAKLSNNKNYKT